ncbi:MAG: 30S ribosomal protein S6 [Candidatus Kaiserbacteria bacterium]|nr:30S ribosomal protein S6 [Candidatus Kaiserbacteria bacterium]
MANQDIDSQTSEIAENESSEPRVYELGFHLDPELPTEEVKKAYQTMRELIAKKGSVVAEGEPEKIPLSYTISRQETSGRRDFDSAYFSWVVYEASAGNHSEVIAAAGADKRIIRFIDLLTTKDAARHSVEVRELSLKTPEHTKEPETDSSVDLDTALERAAV